MIIGGVRGDDRPDADIAIIADPSYRRLKSTVDVALAIKKYYSSQYVVITDLKLWETEALQPVVPHCIVLYLNVYKRVVTSKQYYLP